MNSVKLSVNLDHLEAHVLEFIQLHQDETAAIVKDEIRKMRENGGLEAAIREEVRKQLRQKVTEEVRKEMRRKKARR